MQKAKSIPKVPHTLHQMQNSYREQNRVADIMAKETSQSKDRWREHTVPRPDWEDVLYDNFVGLPFARLINGDT